MFSFTQFVCVCTRVCTCINSYRQIQPRTIWGHSTRAEPIMIMGTIFLVELMPGVRGEKKSCHTERCRPTLLPPPRADCRATSQTTQTALSIFLDVKSYIGVEKHQILGCCVTRKQLQQKHLPGARDPPASQQVVAVHSRNTCGRIRSRVAEKYTADGPQAPFL